MTSRTFLYPVELLGSGTAEVESLSSYLCRLSAVHQVPIGVMLRLTFDWRNESTGSSEPSPYLARNPGTLAHYVRPTETTRSVLGILTLATGEVNLRCGTFMALEAALDRCMRTFHNSIRWCSACMAEFEREGVEPYFKLVWSLTSIDRCPKHGVALTDKCPHCDAKQCGFGIRSSCTKCTRCRKSLICEHLEAVPPGAWKVESADLWRLLLRIGSDPALALPPSGTKKALDELLDDAWKKDRATELWKVVPRDELLAITCSATPVTLTKVRRMAFKLGVDPTDLLDGSVKDTASLLDPGWARTLPKSIRPRKRIEKHNLPQLRQMLDQELRDYARRTPRPLARVAKALGVTTGCIRHHFPVHAYELVTRCARWRRQEALRKKSKATKAVQDFFSEPLRASSATRKGVLRELRTATCLPKDVLRKEIAKAMEVPKWNILRGADCGQPIEKQQ
jgi:hypothetical protein